MENQEDTIGWGSTRVEYEIMTDSKGQKWCVPTAIDGVACDYLRKWDPKSVTTLEFDSVHKIDRE